MSATVLSSRVIEARCPHLQRKQRSSMLNRYCEVLRTAAAYKASSGRCLDGALTEQLHGCLECGFTGTLTELKLHTLDSNHMLGTHIQRGVLYCMGCGDYVYDLEFEFARKELNAEQGQAVSAATRAARDKQQEPGDVKAGARSLPSCEPEAMCLRRKRRRDDASVIWLQAHARAYSRLKPGYQGLRGLHNMGNTCFMNSVLQVLLHTPMMRNFFLGCGHERGICERGASGGGGGSSGVGSGEALHRARPICLGCDMDRLYALMFGAGRGTGLRCQEVQQSQAQQPHVVRDSGPMAAAPAVPHDILFDMWRYAQNLAGYAQQDAHEFCIALLNGLHKHTRPNGYRVSDGTDMQSPRVSSADGRSQCTCCVHRSFGGVFRSDLVCSECGHTSSTYDPFLDISLSLSQSSQSSALALPQPLLSAQQAAAAALASPRPSSGDGAGGSSFMAAAVAEGKPPSGSASSASTQTAMSGEVGGGTTSATGSASTTPATGPEAEPTTPRTRVRSSRIAERDVRGYLDWFTQPELLDINCSVICSSCKCVRACTKQLSVRLLPNVLILHLKRFDALLQRKISVHVKFPRELDMRKYVHTSLRPKAPVMYDLYAVINHHGASVGAGHYTAYVLVSGNWFKCDDQWITCVKESEVLASQGYIMYYTRRTLSYMAAQDSEDSTGDKGSRSGAAAGFATHSQRKSESKNQSGLKASVKLDTNTAIGTSGVTAETTSDGSVSSLTDASSMTDT